MFYLLFLFNSYIVANIDVVKDDKKLRLILISFLFLLLSLFIGLRWEVGSDWEPYYNSFSLDNGHKFEIGYQLFEWIFRELNFSYSVFLLAISSFSLFFISLFLFKRIDYATVSLMFFIANYMLSFMGGNRQIIAIGLVFASNFFIIDRKPFKFLGVIAIACIFHVTAFVYVFSYFFVYRYVSISVRYALLFLGVIIGAYFAPYIIECAIFITKFLGLTFVESKLVAYQTIVFSGFSFLSLIKKIMFLVVFDFYYRKSKKYIDNAMLNLFYNGYYVSILIDAIFGPINSVFMRASVYFRISEIVIVAFMVKSEQHKYGKIILLLVLFALSVRQLHSALGFYPELYEIYNNVLFYL